MHFQDWQPDLLSAIIGLIAGFIAALLIGWLRRLAGRMINQVRERASDARQWVSTGVEGRYREELAEYASSRHLGAGAAALEEIFVPTSVITPLPGPELETNRVLPSPQIAYLWPEEAVQLAIKPPPAIKLERMVTSAGRVALLAPPGGGKSTTLAYIALKCARQDPSFCPGNVPIYAHLAELNLDAEGRKAPRPAEEYLLKAVQQRAGSFTADTLPSLLREALSIGRALVLLDGWDELAPAERPAYSHWLGDLVAGFPGNRYLVAAPLRGYGPLLQLGFVPLTLSTWGTSKASQLLTRWSQALGTPTTSIRIDRRPELDFWQVGITPLDATLNLWLKLAGAPPGDESLIRYQTSINQLLLPLGKDEPNWVVKLGPPALGILASALGSGESWIADHSQLANSIKQASENIGDVPARAIQECRQALVEGSGLLNTWGKNNITFLSPSFFAYFWALGVSGETNLAVDQEKLTDPAWKLPLSFLAQRSEPSDLVDALLSSPPGIFQDPLFQAAQWISNLPDDAQQRRIILVQLAQLLLEADTPLVLRERVVAALVATKDEGVGYLLRQAVASPNPAIRNVVWGGLGALARMPDERSIQSLLSGLRETTQELDVAVIHALAATGTTAGVDALIGCLLDGNAMIRRAAAEALALQGEEGGKILVEALAEEDTLARRAALYGLATIDEPWVTDKLGEVQRQDSEWFVRSTAEDLLNSRLQAQQAESIEVVRPDNLAWLVSWAAERGEGVPAGDLAMRSLEMALLETGRPEVQAMAARSLGEIGSQNAIVLLSELLHHSEGNLREATLFGLGLLDRAWPGMLPAS